MDLLTRLGIDAAAMPTVRATLFHAVFVGAVAIFKSTANALFLAHRPPTELAVLYIVVAALAAVAGALLAGPLSRYAPRTLLIRGTWLFATAAVLLCALVMAGLEAFLPVLYVVAELYATLLSVLFWSTVSAWFDPRSARRAFAVIGAGGMAGAVLGGLFTRMFADWMGAAGAAALGAALPLLALSWLREARQVVPPRGPAPSLPSGAAYLVGRPYPRRLAALAVSSAALAACVDYLFRVEAAARLSELELAALFGDLNAVVGGAALAYQLFVTRWLLNRAGLFVFLAVVPAALGLLAGVAALTGSFAVIVIVKGLEMAGSYSIQPSGTQLLYNPIHHPLRPAVRAFVDGPVKKAGLALGGAGLIVLGESVPAAVSPWLVVAMAALTLLVVQAQRRGYLMALEEKLRGARPAVVTPDVEVRDRATREALTRALESPNGTVVRAALAVLAKDRRFRPQDHLATLLTHEDPGVRVAALELVPENSSPDVEFTLVSILSLDQRRPRAAAVRAFARCCPGRAGEVLEAYLRDPDPGVACAVIAALQGLPAHQHAALRRLEEVAAPKRAPDPAWRRELARLTGELPTPLALEHLSGFLEDEEASVRALAMESAAQIFSRAVAAGEAEAVRPLVALVQGRLAVRSDRDAAREALACLGDWVVPFLRESLDDRHLPLAVRIEVPRLLRSIGTAAAAEVLLFSNIRDHPSLRYRIVESLFRLCREHPEVQIDLARANEACLRRLRGFRHHRRHAHALVALGAGIPEGAAGKRAWEVLRRIVTDRMLQNLEMAMHLLGLRRGPERMDRVARLLMETERRALAGDTPEAVRLMRADALEVLDVALEGDPVRFEVMTTLEKPPEIDGASGPLWADGVEAAAVLQRSADPLVSALALRALADWGVDDTPFGSTASPDTVVSDPTDSEEVPKMNEELVGRILALEQVDLFAGLSVDDVAAIAGIATEKHAGPGEVLYREGELGDRMMVIIRGRVRLLRHGRVFLEHGAGESIGQVSLLDRGPRPTTAVVSQDPEGADLLVLNGDAFMDLVTDRPGLARGMFAVLANRLRALIDLQGPRGAKGQPA